MFRIIYTIHRDYFLNINRLVSVKDTVFSVRYEIGLYNTMHINRYPANVEYRVN
jgi:hypothetical protein